MKNLKLFSKIHFQIQNRHKNLVLISLFWNLQLFVDEYFEKLVLTLIKMNNKEFIKAFHVFKLSQIITNYDSIVNKSFAYKHIDSIFWIAGRIKRIPKLMRKRLNMCFLLRICFYYIRNIQIQYKPKKSFIIRGKSRF